MSMWKCFLRASVFWFHLKAGKEFLGGEKLGDTRLNTQARQAARKAAMRKSQSIKRTIEEGEALPFIILNKRRFYQITSCA